MRDANSVRGLVIAAVCGWAAMAAPALAGGPSEWVHEFPTTDFDNNSIDLDEIITDGPRRDTIPPIDNPVFVSAAEAEIGPD